MDYQATRLASLQLDLLLLRHNAKHNKICTKNRFQKGGLTLTKGTPLKTKIGADFIVIYRESDKLMPMKLTESMERVK